ncbi:MAG: WecB/TagA/CpsF family glycosyltransferase [Alphaproteobacteria bacterium]|nr:WecB/TagA/CpsF family glycosyltransferase [Alphaproteobacteria bacterium]
MKQDRAILDLVDKMTIINEQAQLETFLKNISKADQKKAMTVCFINAHALNLCYQDIDFLNNVRACDYILRDGIGMKILFKLLGRNPGLNLNGTDLIPQILNQFKSRNVSIFGTQQHYLDISSKKINAMGLDVVASADGFQADDVYIKNAENTPADLIILAMGMPKQEHIANTLVQHISQPSLIICGGAILDFMADKVKRAPQFFRQYGIEWVYRLIQEPRRLFKRYVIGNFIMLFHAMCLTIEDRK